MRTPALLILVVSALFALQTAASRPLPAKTASVYETLLSHGLPMGLLPKGVKNYTLSDDGRFEVFLEHSCNAKFESEIHYDRNIFGWLSYGEIANLTGIAAQELFLWFPVKHIRLDEPSSGLIIFDVGVVVKQYSVSMFEQPPDCFAGALPPEVVAGGGMVNDLLKQVGESIKHPFDREESRSESI